MTTLLYTSSFYFIHAFTPNISTNRPLLWLQSRIEPINYITTLFEKRGNIEKIENIEKIKRTQLKFLQMKYNAFLKLSRASNILPTLFLIGTGGWMVCPSLYHLYRSSTFIISIINTILILLNSMALNDLFDIEVDRKNMLKRPLVTGEISIKEARIFSLCLFGLTEFLTFRYLPKPLFWMIQIALFQTLLYTPYFKHVILIKNLSCASLVSFAVCFGGLSAPVIPEFILGSEKNMDLLWMTCRFIFLGSFYNELMLDMRDIPGDQENNIITIPVLFGKKRSWNFAYFILNFSILLNTIELIRLTNIRSGSGFFLLCTPLLYELEKVKRENYSNIAILHCVKKTNGPLFTTLIYLAFIARRKI